MKQTSVPLFPPLITELLAFASVTIFFFFLSFLYVPEVKIFIYLFFFLGKERPTRDFPDASWTSGHESSASHSLDQAWRRRGSSDGKARIWLIKYNLYSTTTLPPARSTSPNCEHLQCNCLKKKLPDFFSCCLPSLQLSAGTSDQWRSLSMLPCWSYQLHLLKLEAWLLLQLNETSLSCFSTSFFPPSFPVFCGSLSIFFSNSHVHRMNEELLRCTDGMKLNQISN